MKPRTKWIAAGAATLVLLGAGTGVAVATNSDDDAGDTAITGAALDQASSAALAFTGGGRVTETEVGDEEGFYEVEVTLENGSEVDVHLDRSFSVIDSSADRPGHDDDQPGQNDGENDENGENDD